MTTILYTGQYERLTLQTGFSLTVSRDLKPENILFRTKDMKSDIVIADFGM
jgi:serine/threonine protein kinase